jgi:hypothetical protein
METHKVEIHGKEYTIIVWDDYTYRIHSEDTQEFVLIAGIGDTGIVWILTKGTASSDLINSVGQAIMSLES